MDKIEIETLLSNVGKALTSFEIESFLNEIKVKRRPFLTEIDIENSVYNKWIPIKKLGLELEFRNQANFEKLENENLGSSPLILTSLIFYSDKEEMRDYAYSLPNNIKFNNNPAEVRALFKDSDCVLKSYIRDVFVCQNYQIIVSYNESRTKVDDITYMLIPEKTEEEPTQNLPSVEKLIDLLGENRKSKKLQDVLGFFDINDYTEDRKKISPYLLAKELGLTFVFSDDEEGGNLYEIIFYNRGYLNFSKGYTGKLPYNLEFVQAPNEILSTIKQEALFWEDDFLQGRARWIFTNYSLQIDYSVLMNYIAKVHIYPVWYWDDEFRSDWEVNPYNVNCIKPDSSVVKNIHVNNELPNVLVPKTGNYRATLPTNHPQTQQLKLDPFSYTTYNKGDRFSYIGLEDYDISKITWVEA